jgi:hypothetical protein
MKRIYPLTPAHLRPKPNHSERNFDHEYDDYEEYGNYYSGLMEGNSYKYTPYEKTGHDYLRDLCRTKNVYSSSTHTLNPLSNRALFIIQALNDMNLPYKLDIFNRSYSYCFSFDEPKLCNIIVELPSDSKEPAIVLSAHHDVSNIHCDNAQDNSASVCNLIHLCKILSKEKLNRRVLIVFTDGEECGMMGAKQFVKKAKDKKYGEIEFSLILELTGLGTEFWVDTKNTGGSRNAKSVKRIEEVFGRDKFHHVSTPPSDVGAFRNEFMDASCIGILPKSDLYNHELWRICHSPNDTVDKTEEKDMLAFVEVLRQIIQGKPEPTEPKEIKQIPEEV